MDPGEFSVVAYFGFMMPRVAHPYCRKIKSAAGTIDVFRAYGTYLRRISFPPAEAGGYGNAAASRLKANHYRIFDASTVLHVII
jgi:hypothetical protein